MPQRVPYDEKLQQILKTSAAIFAEKGYHQASIRDIAGATGASLSGLYYYFASKEELLFLIQQHCFETLLARAKAQLEQVDEPRDRFRVFVSNHLRFFVSNVPEMKVLSHEADSLTGPLLDRVRALKREYVDTLEGILEGLGPAEGGVDLRVATFSLFGMMNWLYTWYRPERDGGAEELTEAVIHTFLHGFLSKPEPVTGSPGPEAPADEASSIWRS